MRHYLKIGLGLFKKFPCIDMLKAQNKEEDRNVHLIASLINKYFTQIDTPRLNDSCHVMPCEYSDLLTGKEIAIYYTRIFTDGKPQLEMLNSYWIEQWCKITINEYLKDFTLR